MSSVVVLVFTDDAIPHATAQCYGIDPYTEGLVKRVVSQNHLAVLRHGFASVEISNISRPIGRQLLRKAHADYMEKSQRYVDMVNGEFILPAGIIGNSELCDIFTKSFERSRKDYVEARKAGALKEDARYLLAQAIETSMVMSGNLQMWWDFFNLRINKRTQLETRIIAMKILQQFRYESEIFDLHPKKDFKI